MKDGGFFQLERRGLHHINSHVRHTMDAYNDKPQDLIDSSDEDDDSDDDDDSEDEDDSNDTDNSDDEGMSRVLLPTIFNQMVSNPILCSFDLSERV